MDLVVLKEELLAGHPSTGSYNADHQIAADEINAFNITRIRESMLGEEVLRQTDAAEFNSKADSQKSQWLALCAIETLDPKNGELAAEMVQDIFGSGATQSALVAARNEIVSQAIVVKLGNVRGGDVEKARALP